MAKTKKLQPKSKSTSNDGAYILKLVLYVVLGSLWLKIGHASSNFAVPIPLGLIVGLLFTSHEQFRIDRKIEYAVLVLAALFGFLAPFGLFISF